MSITEGKAYKNATKNAQTIELAGGLAGNRTWFVVKYMEQEDVCVQEATLSAAYEGLEVAAQVGNSIFHYTDEFDAYVRNVNALRKAKANKPRKKTGPKASAELHEILKAMQDRIVDLESRVEYLENVATEPQRKVAIFGGKTR